jgi:hypothetical protein
VTYLKQQYHREELLLLREGMLIENLPLDIDTLNKKYDLKN